MLDALNAATFLVTSRNPGNESFGTAFLIHKDRRSATFLTAAHVVVDMGGPERVLVEHRPVRVAAMGRPESAEDMAVLQWAAEPDPSGTAPDGDAPWSGWPAGLPLQMEIIRQPCIPILIVGQKPYDTQKKFRLAALHGDLGQSCLYDSKKGSCRVKGWELALAEGSSLAEGFSGAAVVDANTGNAVAVVTHLLGQRGGLAISVEQLKRLWPHRPEGLVIRRGGVRLKPGLLPHLADREPQIGAIEKHIVLDLPGPNVWVIHGEQNESLDKFLECFRCHHIRRLTPNDDNCANLHAVYFNWPRACASYDDYQAQVMRQLRERLKIANAKPEELMLAINNSTNAPLLIWSRVDSIVWQGYGDKIVPYLLRLSRNWPRRVSGKLMIICLLVKYRRTSPKGIFKRLGMGRESFDKHNRKMRQFFVQRQGRPQQMSDVTGHILPEMQGITQIDAENWTEDPEIKNKCANMDFMPAIREMFAECEVLPMAIFAEGIQKLMGVK